MTARMAHFFGGLLVALLGAVASTATAQTPLPAGFEINLLPGYTQEMGRGIDSIVGKLVKKDGLEISYEIGGNPKPGAPRFGGSYVNYAQKLPAEERLWLKEQTFGNRRISVACNKDNCLFISMATETHGINFTAIAKTPQEIADVLLMTLTIAEQKKDAK